MAGKYILAALRQAQEVHLRAILGDCLLEALKGKVADGTLAGSNATLWHCVRQAVKFGVPFADAVRMATATPAAAAHLDAGVLAPGRPADVLLVDLSGPLPELKTVVLRGEVFA